MADVPHPINIIRNLKERSGERTIVFFDAVMAIAITLLALEIGIPEGGAFEAGEFEELFIPFTALFVSFIVLGQVWYVHVKAFAYEGLARTCSIGDHLVLMFFVVLFPKTTELIATHPGSTYAIAIYLVCYLAVVISETVTILRAYARQMKIYERALAAHHGFELSKENVVKAAQGLASRYGVCDRLVSSLKRVIRADAISMVVALVATFGSVFALFIYPAACYAFFAADLAVTMFTARRSERERNLIMDVWYQQEESDEAQEEEQQAA